MPFKTREVRESRARIVNVQESQESTPGLLKGLQIRAKYPLDCQHLLELFLTIQKLRNRERTIISRGERKKPHIFLKNFVILKKIQNSTKKFICEGDLDFPEL
jgi:hypothetical protein